MVNKFTVINRSNNTDINNSDYQCLPTRFRTFETWPSALKQQPQELADAGFFYTGNGDRVICFCCGTNFKHWQEDHIPIEQHAIQSQRCSYLKSIKGEVYCQQIRDKYKQLESVVPTISPLELDKIGEEKHHICKVCCGKPVELVFIRCGHAATCLQCGYAMPNCPVCRANIMLKIKFSFGKDN